MADFGVQMQNDGYRRFRVTAGQRYRGRAYTVGTGRVGGVVLLRGGGGYGRARADRTAAVDLGAGRPGTAGGARGDGLSGQPERDRDRGRGPGATRGVSADFTRMGDVASTLAAIAPFASGPVTLTGIAQTHFEESDRPVAVATELQRMGIQVESTWDSLRIYPGDPRPCVVQTYDDHRMAMSFAITALRAPGLEIANPGCVAKTFPRFFEVLHQAMPAA